MQNKENQSKRIYLKTTSEWVEVSKEYCHDHTRYHDALRKHQQSHGQCICPKNKFCLCKGDCLTCEFRRAGDMISLDNAIENEEGDTCSLLNNLVDPTHSIEEIICDKIELDRLFARLNELMPEAIEIGKLRLDGFSDEEIAKSIGIKRTTFLSRLKKIKEQLSHKHPDLF